MNIQKIAKLSTASKLSLLAVVVLLGAIFFTVNSALEQQSNSGHANTTTYASIGIRGTTFTTNDGSAYISLVKPSNVSAGDVLFAQVVVHGATNTITPPSGWTLIRRDNTSSNIADAVYYHVATGVDATGPTWHFGTAAYSSGGIIALTNVNTQNPVDDDSGSFNDTTATMTAPSVTTTTPADKLLFFGGVVGVASNITAPSGMTSKWTAYNNGTSGNTTSYLATQLLSTQGPTGNKVGTSSSTASNIAQLVAVRPASNTVIPTNTPAPQPTTQPTLAQETGNLLQNSSFENGKPPWSLNVTSPGAGAFNISTNYFYDGAASAVVNVTTSNSNDWYVQLKQNNISLQAGQTYSVSFWAKAAASRSFESVIQGDVAPNTVYVEKSHNASTSWQRYAYTFVAPANDEDAFIGFNLSTSTGQIWIDNVELDAGSTPQPTTPPATATPAPTACPVPSGCLKNGVNTCLMPVGGWCGFGTPTPVPATPTLIPATPTACPPPPSCFQDGVNICTIPVRGWCAFGTPTPVPTTNPTRVPTTIPTHVPTSVPQPTATPIPGDTVLALNVSLHGIGTGGDSANPNSDGNMSPLHPSRSVTVDIYDVQNQLAASEQSTIQYNQNTGKFTGSVDLGSAFNTGLYTVKIKSDQYLRAIVPGIQTITAGHSVTLPAVTLVTGDLNGDNAINIVDYNILIGCYSDLLPATDCNATNNILSDITDDGHVNQFDYNLFLRELTNIGGQ